MTNGSEKGYERKIGEFLRGIEYIDVLSNSKEFGKRCSKIQLETLERLHRTEKVVLTARSKKKLLNVVKIDEKVLELNAECINSNSVQFYITKPILKHEKIKTNVHKGLKSYIKSLKKVKLPSSDKKDGNKITSNERYKLTKEIITLTTTEKAALTTAIEKEPLNVHSMELPPLIMEDEFFVDEWIPAPINLTQPINLGYPSFDTTVYYNINDVLEEDLSIVPIIETDFFTALPITEEEFQNSFMILEPIHTVLGEEERKLVLPNWKSTSRERVPWVVTNDRKDMVLDESISKTELKFKVDTPVIPPIGKLETCFVFKDIWNYSKFKTYMMDWKPFSKLNPDVVLNEHLTFPQPRIHIDTDLSVMRWIKLVEMELGSECEESQDVCLIEEIANINYSESDVVVEGTVEHSLELPGEVEPEVIEVEDDDIVIVKEVVTRELETAHERYISKIPTSSSMRSITRNGCTASKISQSMKSKSTLDQLIAKRKKLNSKLSKVAAYPNLEQLNLTTTSERITPPPPQSFELVQHMITPESLQFYQPQLPHFPVPHSEFSNILSDGSTELANVVDISTSMPESIIICLNSSFPNKYGAVYLKFETVISKISVEIIEMTIPEQRDVIEIDMFLNKGCGVLFLGLIELQQVNLQTNEFVIFEQLDSIGSQITSLIIVILIDEFSMNGNINGILEELKKWGVLVIKIPDQVNEIVKCMVKLIEQYSSCLEIDWDDLRVEKFSKIGVQNPLFIQWIINNMGKLRELSRSDMIRELLNFCSDELAEVISNEVFRS